MLHKNPSCRVYLAVSIVVTSLQGCVTDNITTLIYDAMVLITAIFFGWGAFEVCNCLLIT